MQENEATMTEKEKDAMRLLEATAPGIYFRGYDIRVAKNLGNDVKAAIFLNQCRFWSGWTNNEDGWIWKTIGQVEKELGLTRKEQDSAILKLTTAGLIQKKRGYMARRNFRLTIRAVQFYMEITQITQTDRKTDRKSECPKRTLRTVQKERFGMSFLDIPSSKTP